MGRIAFITGEYPKPSERFILRELAELRRRGHDFVVVATRRLEDIPESQGIDAAVLLRPPFLSLRSLVAEVRFALTHPLRYVMMLCQLYAGHWRSLRELMQVLSNFPRALAVGYQLRKQGVTRVHALWASFPATLGWVIARGLGMDFSFSAHARDVTVEGRMLREKMNHSRHAIVCSRSAADHLKLISGDRLARKIALVHHGLDAEALPDRSKTPGEMILAAGRLEEKKGFDVLIRACHLLKERGRNAQCVIVGDGTLRPKLTRLAGDVELRPWMRHDDLMQWVAEAGVVVVPSVVARDGDRDGIPNILLEAMAIGTPVVATDVGGIGEVVRDGETGSLVSPGDAGALADAIERILTDPDQKSAITGHAKLLIRQEFTLSGTLEILERLLMDP